LVDLERAKKEIEENLPLLDGILFSGGEPTLQRETLIELASWAKKKGLLVGVETNGTKPEVLRELISKNLIDFIALDIKCELSGERYKEVTGFDEEVVSQVKQSIELIKRSRVEHEFRTTLVPSLVTLKDVKQISLKLRQGKYILQRFRYDRGKLVDQSLVGKDFSKEEIKEIIALAKARVNITARSWR
jgi:pyruvate formate lyase activating enzyme